MLWLYYILLLVVSGAGLFINILGLPGLWLMVAAHVAFAWATGWGVYAGWPSVIALIVLGLLAELFEFLAGAAGSKAAGGRKRGMIGAVVGALIGGIVGSPILPIIGTILGACLGAFIGAAVMEFYDRDFHHAMRVGVGAAKGRFWGIVIKGGIGLVMLLVILIAALPLGAPAPPVVPPPTVLPRTTPSTTESETLNSESTTRPATSAEAPL
jgi:uncharacterized protein YqgC (DUF456 family)